jgi:hypothetical protein
LGKCFDGLVGLIRPFPPKSVLPDPQDAGFLAAQDDAGQWSAIHGAGIDIDPVVVDVRPVPDRRVAMDDDEPVVRLVQEKRLSDPNQVQVSLLRQWPPGHDARMDEDMAAVLVETAKPIQPFQVPPQPNLVLALAAPGFFAAIQQPAS